MAQTLTVVHFGTKAAMELVHDLEAVQATMQMVISGLAAGHPLLAIAINLNY